MTTLLKVIERLLVCFWKFKFEVISFLLSVAVVCLVSYADSLQVDLQNQLQANEDYKLKQLVTHERMLAVNNDRLLVAQEKYSEKIKALERSNAELALSRDRVSVALSEAKRKFAVASEEARIEYLNTLDTVSGQCIAEYSTMAKNADGHAVDAEKLSNSWPLIKPP